MRGRRVCPGNPGVRRASASAMLAVVLAAGAQAGSAPPASAKTKTLPASLRALGLDACAAPSVGQMRAFKRGTPYRWFNIYIGGSARACPQPNLTRSWIAAVRKQGWDLLPTWVGPQPPCSGFSPNFSSNVGTAYRQGLGEARSAYVAIGRLAIEVDTPIVYDMESFSENLTPACLAAAESFVRGWAEFLGHPPRQVSGIYGSDCGSKLDNIAGIPRPPDFVWGAFYNGNPNPANLVCLGSQQWSHHKRHKQYRGGHDETWNGVTLNVDNNGSDGPVFD